MSKSGQGFSPSRNNINKETKKDLEVTEDRYVIRKGLGLSVKTNHCSSFNLDFPELSAVHSDPPIFEIKNFFNQKTCENMFETGTIIDCQTLKKSALSKRTSTTSYLDYKDANEFIQLTEILTGIDSCCYEEPQVVRYNNGEQFTWHYDAIQPQLIDSSGNRIVTLIVYLNNVNNGGETSFKDLELKIKPEIGKALVFFPSYKNGIIDDRTIHAGLPTNETKWIAQIWIRENKYIPSMRQQQINKQVENYLKKKI